MRCLILPHLASEGPRNMAIDERMLERVGSDPTVAMMRTYAWSDPTLSLGYFQRRAEADTDPRWTGVPIVRRATGGGAIWHHRELTYAVVVPRAHPMAARASDLYRAVHGAIAALLADLGFPARRRGEAEARQGGDDRPFLCFRDRDAEDLVVHGSKVLGSAQRRRTGALLQQGSLLLARSDRTPDLPGLADRGALSPAETDPIAWDEPVRDRIISALGLVPSRHELAFNDWERVESIADAVYRDPAWTNRR